MREAIGSTFLFKIMIFFIFFFASFLAISINYSQAFRLKNQIINILEQQEGLNAGAITRIEELVKNYGYYRSNVCNCTEKACNGVPDRKANGIEPGNVHGICVKKQIANGDSGYYKVTTYVSFNFPIVGNLVSVPVSGETKVITNLHED